MPNQTAVQLKEALESGEKIKALADQLMLDIAPATSGVVDAGVNTVIAIREGYGPLDDPRDYFFVLSQL